MRFHVIAFTVYSLLAALPGLAQNSRNDTVEREIAQLDREFHAARLRNDVAAVNRLLAPDYYQINTGGQRVNAGNSGSGPFNTTPDGRPWQNVEIEDHRVRAYGDAALSTYLRIVHLRPEDGGTAQLVMTHVWVRRDNRWQLALSQGTSVQD